MIFYKDDYTIEKTLNLKPNLEQKFLLEFTGRNFQPREAEKIWPKVIDHKWYVSERLGRNIGLRVAAVDYIHNFYEPPVEEKKDGFIRSIGRFLRTVINPVGPPPVTKKFTY